VHGDAADLRAVELALAGMDAGADLDAELPHGLSGRERAADGARRTVEGGEEAVARRVHLPAAEAVELAPDRAVVFAEQLAPATVS
jgi:hypothetical protein